MRRNPPFIVRHLMIRSAFAGPTVGNISSCSAVAVLRFSLPVSAIAGFFHGRAPPNSAAEPGEGFAACCDEGAFASWPAEVVGGGIPPDDDVPDDDVPDDDVPDDDAPEDDVPDDDVPEDDEPEEDVLDHDGVLDDGVSGDNASFCDGGAALAKRHRPPIANTISATPANVGSAYRI